MGLLDKLREAVESVLDSDPTSKQYYDIVLNLLICEKRLTKEHIQAFIQGKYKEECNVAVLDKVLTKFDTKTEPKTRETWYQLTFKQAFPGSNQEAGPSCYTKEEVWSICFAGLREEIRAKFRNVYGVVKQNPTPHILKQGIDKVTEDLPQWPDYPNTTVAAQVIGEEICNLLFAGDALIESIAADKAHWWLRYTYEEKKAEYITHLYAFVVHALHYEKVNLQNVYPSITKAECDAAVAQSAYFQKQAAQNPFNKDAILQNASEWILKRELILASSAFEWECWAVKNRKFVDASCHLALCAILEGYESPADNVEETVLIVNDYLMNGGK